MAAPLLWARPAHPWLPLGDQLAAAPPNIQTISSCLSGQIHFAARSRCQLKSNPDLASFQVEEQSAQVGRRWAPEERRLPLATCHVSRARQWRRLISLIESIIVLSFLRLKSDVFGCNVCKLAACE